MVSHQVEEEPLDVDEPAAADGEGMGGGRPELGEEDVHRLLGVEMRVPSDVVLLAVDAADEKHGQVRGLPLEADPQMQELLPATSLQVICYMLSNENLPYKRDGLLSEYIDGGGWDHQ